MIDSCGRPLYYADTANDLALRRPAGMKKLLKVFARAVTSTLPPAFVAGAVVEPREDPALQCPEFPGHGEDSRRSL